MNSIIYLRKTKALENSPNNTIEEYHSFYETPEEYIEKMKTKSITSDVKSNINFHLSQLMDIAINSQLLYQWIRMNSSQAKINFVHSILDESILLDKLHYKKFHFSELEFFDFPEKLQLSLFSLYKEKISELHQYILQIIKNTPDIYLESNKPNIVQLDNIFNGLINQGLCIQLGLYSSLYNFPRVISYDGKVSDNFKYLDVTISQYNKNRNTLTKIYNQESLFSDTSNDALDYFVSIWSLLGTSERKSKTIKYTSLSHEEIISKFYEVYSGVPKNFLEILLAYDYEDKRILTANYHLEEHIRLVINYLYQQTGNSDYPLLERLFNKNNLRSYYDKNYSSDRIKKFEIYLEKYKK